MRRGTSYAALLALSLPLLLAAPAAAAGPGKPPPRCFVADQYGQPATCTWTGDHWVRTFDGGMAGAGNGFGLVIAFGVIAMFAALGAAVWKVSTARKMATDAGMDPDRAGMMAVLTDDGLEATYLASSLRGQPEPQAATPQVPESAAPVADLAPARTATERLAELEQLHAAGAVSDAEYAGRRKAIIDSI